jgi:hypothetical protein
MADSTGSTLTREERQALAGRLADHADSITNITAHELEVDLRKAAAELHAVDAPRLRATLPALKFELHQTAARCSDPVTVKQLRILAGEESA